MKTRIVPGGREKGERDTARSRRERSPLRGKRGKGKRGRDPACHLLGKRRNQARVLEGKRERKRREKGGSLPLLRPRKEGRHKKREEGERSSLYPAELAEHLFSSI